MERPVPGQRELLISVRAAGVTPTELLWYPSTHTREGAPRLLAVPGHEFSGVVEAVGPGVNHFKQGDEVFGMNDWFASGATAEYCVASEDSIALKPSSVTHTTAAAAPIAALTSWQGLVDRMHVQPAERVLIVGAGGSVGLMCIQIAVMRGCHVIASAASSQAEVLKNLGCERIFDYKSEPFENYVRDIDVIFDAVGGDTLTRAERVMKPSGRRVTIAADAEATNDAAIKQAFFIVEPSASQLANMSTLMEKERLQVFVKKTLPFERAADAYLDKSIGADGIGKLVLVL
ncbi:MAG TPA: NADP-dependent oxidoreductase [Acidobacteriaceae bacterium]|nr:NADP-dependent oxidoreductase [Acidobacteriaceae bacterium]